MIRLARLLVGAICAFAVLLTSAPPASAACPGRQTTCGLLGAVSGSGSESNDGGYILSGSFIGFVPTGTSGDDSNLPVRLGFNAEGYYTLARSHFRVGWGSVQLTDAAGVPVFAFSITVFKSPAGWLILPTTNNRTVRVDLASGSYLGGSAAGGFSGTLSYQFAER